MEERVFREERLTIVLWQAHISETLACLMSGQMQGIGHPAPVSNLTGFDVRPDHGILLGRGRILRQPTQHLLRCELAAMFLLDRLLL